MSIDDDDDDDDDGDDDDDDDEPSEFTAEKGEQVPPPARRGKEQRGTSQPHLIQVSCRVYLDTNSLQPLLRLTEVSQKDQRVMMFRIIKTTIICTPSRASTISDTKRPGLTDERLTISILMYLHVHVT